LGIGHWSLVIGECLIASGWILLETATATEHFINQWLDFGIPTLPAIFQVLSILVYDA
jgi:hypothetical protein